MMVRTTRSQLVFKTVLAVVVAPSLPSEVVDYSLVWTEEVVWTEVVVWTEAVVWTEVVVWTEEVVWTEAAVWTEVVVWTEEVVWTEAAVWTEVVVWTEEVVWTAASSLNRNQSWNGQSRTFRRENGLGFSYYCFIAILSKQRQRKQQQ